MSYAAVEAREVLADAREAGEGATCTVRVKTGQHMSGNSTVEDFATHDGISVMDTGLQDVAVGGGYVRRQTYTIPGKQLDALGVELTKAFEITVDGRTFKINSEMGVQAVRPNPGGATLMYRLEVLG